MTHDPIRHDWTLAEVQGLFALPFTDLILGAQRVHRAHHEPNTVQMSTLLSIKTGACPEDCAYCPQSVRYDTGLAPQALLEVAAVRECAARAKAAGATRFCMGAADRSPKPAYHALREAIVSGRFQPSERLVEMDVARELGVGRSAVRTALARLEHEEVVQIVMTEPQNLLPATLPMQYSGITVSLYMALRRGGEIIGVQSAGYRGRQEPFTSQQKRIARGIAQLASLALNNAQLFGQAETANRLKTDFLATMSHELRTPLHIIMGYTGLLLEDEFGGLAPEQVNVLQRVDKSAKQLFDLITATLDVSRLEAGRLPVEVEEVDLPQLLGELEAETQDLLREKPQLSFAWQVTPGLLLRTDRAKLKVILKNLISNAVKFTDEGSVTVDAHLCERGVEICVTDTGVGIAAEVLPEIFEMFRQADSSMTRLYRGVGLGLYIVRRLLELLRGTVAVESAVGRGSTFRVWVPLRFSA